MKMFKKSSVLVLFSIWILLLGAVTFTPSAGAAPATFAVNVTTDEVDVNPGDGTCETVNAGECTLRAAIEEANSTVDEDTAVFEIPGTGIHTITLTDSLPAISNPLIINGYSQLGSSDNTTVSPAPLDATITIGIDGTSATNAALIIDAANSSITGISIYSCSVACLAVTETDVTVRGNFIGVDPSGLSLGTLQTQVGLLSADAGNNLNVGGLNPEDRNVIVAGSGSDTYSLATQFTGGHEIYGNYIGLGRDGVTDYGTTKGIFFLGNQNSQIGGPQTGAANLLGGGQEEQINTVFASNITIQGNLVGTDHTGNANSNINNGTGIIAGIASTNVLVGGTNPGEGNLIAGISGVGIAGLSANSVAFGGDAIATNNAFLGNTIRDIGIIDYPNFGDSNQGIDLFFYQGDDFGVPVSFDNQGVTLNDAGDSDTGSNEYLNYPVINSAVQDNSGEIAINFDLDAAGSVSGDYRIEFFANDTGTIFGHGPGETFIGSVTVEAGDNQDAVFTTPSSIDVTGKSLSATATMVGGAAPSGFGSTSEFAKNVLIGSETDFDSDTISDAIEQAAPNSGDANDDGIPDFEQPTVSSFISIETGEYISFVTSGCSSNALVTSLAESTLDTTDANFTYPFGLTDFVLNCSRGDTVTIDKYIFTPEVDVTDFSVRKYHPGTQTFNQVEGSTVVSETIGGEHSIHLNYSITDGESGDDDGTANGIIVDPVGLAEIFVASQSVTNPSTGNTTATGTLPATGRSFDWQTPIILFELGLLLLLISNFSKKKHGLRNIK